MKATVLALFLAVPSADAFGPFGGALNKFKKADYEYSPYEYDDYEYSPYEYDEDWDMKKARLQFHKDTFFDVRSIL